MRYGQASQMNACRTRSDGLLDDRLIPVVVECYDGTESSCVKRLFHTACNRNRNICSRSSRLAVQKRGSFTAAHLNRERQHANYEASRLSLQHDMPRTLCVCV